MHQVIFLILRRMRAPLIVLISAYAISIIGMVLMPGVDDQGRPWHMDFFHAIYFVSFMATTIGFGEIPYEFSDAQRMWALFSIYFTVISWLYAIGKILTLVQDSGFKQAVTEQAFARGVSRLTEPFYIVCGYGDTGSMLVHAMDQRGMRTVVIDILPERVNALELEDLHSYTPGLCTDARREEAIKEAGLLHSHCVGILALTNDDQVNLKIAITSKLLRPNLKVICRAETHDAEANMDSFGTDYIINPFKTFGDRLALALHSPGTYLLYEWLTGVPGMPLPQPLFPPHGTWVLCGYGRFGKAVYKNLRREDVDTTIIEADPEGTECGDMCVVGRGTEAKTLRSAKIKDAVGIVAGTDNDTNNLSIIMTAHDLKPDLFMVARQNRQDNGEIFQKAELDLVMQRSESIVQDIFALLTAPLLIDFLRLIRGKDNEWANQLISRISAVVNEVIPEIWVVTIDMDKAPAVAEALIDGRLVSLDQLMLDPRDRTKHLPCIPLILERDGDEWLTPDGGYQVQDGDQLLFCGNAMAKERMQWTLVNRNALVYIREGEERPDSYVWRWFSR